MAKKPTKKSVKAPSQASSDTTVTRIVASDDKRSKPSIAKSSKKVITPIPKQSTDATAKKPRKNPARGFGGYFTGAWYELRQVRWPDHRATWSMTGALIAFTLAFVVIILLLDALFQYLFTLIIK